MKKNIADSKPNTKVEESSSKGKTSSEHLDYLPSEMPSYMDDID